VTGRARLGRSARSGSAGLPRNLTRALAILALLAGQLGPLTPTARGLAPGDDVVADAKPATGPDGDAVVANPAPITTPPSAGASAAAVDPSILGAPGFAPYVAPDAKVELASERTETSRTFASRILTQKTWDRGASPAADSLKFTKTLTWTKDGSPATVAEGSTTLTYEYDTAGRPSAFKTGSTTLTGWTYTAGTSTVATRTDGTLGTTTFGYDWARRVTSITAPASFVSGTLSRTYRLDGLLASQAFPSSISETLAYDAAKRPVSIGLGAAGSISLAFDRAGNLTADGRSLTGVSGDAGSGTQTFTYDGLRRLTGSSGLAVNRGYTFDLDGNRLTRTVGGSTTTVTYDRTDVAVTQNGSPLFSADRYGNLLQAPDSTGAVTGYAYDEANRLTTITPPGANPAATFTLDPLDRHATRTVGAATDTYGYTGPTETAFETSATGTRSLLDVDGSRLAIKNGSSVAWVIFDLHGSVVALCPAGGTTISDAYRFDGWGEKIAWSEPTANPWKYRGLLGIAPGSIADQLYDMGARDYAPALGTFTQLDSIQGNAANPLTMNRFVYALANPATLIDPDGHMALEDETCSTCASAVISGNTINVVDGGSRTTIRTKKTRASEGTCATLCAGPALEVELVNGWVLGPDGSMIDPEQYERIAGSCSMVWGAPDPGGNLRGLVEDEREASPTRS
jgi:RHS repeat-associated protein